eukprot:359932-Chlamydomonas_euryale.AAC.2
MAGRQADLPAWLPLCLKRHCGKLPAWLPAAAAIVKQAATQWNSSVVKVTNFPRLARLPSRPHRSSLPRPPRPAYMVFTSRAGHARPRVLSAHKRMANQNFQGAS